MNTNSRRLTSPIKKKKKFYYCCLNYKKNDDRRWTKQWTTGSGPVNMSSTSATSCVAEHVSNANYDDITLIMLKGTVALQNTTLPAPGLNEKQTDNAYKSTDSTD